MGTIAGNRPAGLRAFVAELPRIEAYDGRVRGELEYAMPASSSMPSPHCIGILMSAAGRFLECRDCHLSFEFPSGSHYDTIAGQFESHSCSSPIAPKDDVKRGNPAWGLPIPLLPALPTEFEMQARHLGLTKDAYATSAQLRIWCKRNRNRCYIPEWLLDAWGIEVDQ